VKGKDSPNCSIPLCSGHYSTIDQTAQPPIPSLTCRPLTRPPVFHPGDGRPGVHSLLHPYRYSLDANSAPFFFEIDQYPPPFPQLDPIDIELGQLLSAQPSRITEMT
jgi:hypothetical protein